VDYKPALTSDIVPAPETPPSALPPVHARSTTTTGTLTDGLHQVTTRYLCAGYVVENGKITMCAPILRKKLAYWTTIAVPVN